MAAERSDTAINRPDLVHEFRNRPSSDAKLVPIGNLTLLVLCTVLFLDDIPGPLLGAWVALVAATTAARAGWRFRAGRLPPGDEAFARTMRVTVAAQALAWGAGAAVLMPWMANQELAIFIAGLAGLIGSALNTLSADRRSFHWFAAGISGPLTLGLLRFPDQPHLVLAVLTVVFALTMLFIHRQVNRRLAEHLRLVARLKASEQAQAKLIAELRAALGNVKQLTGLLPICANCRKVRDDFGYWNSVEHYVTTHTDARFSHGVCPECYPKLFPGIPLPEPEEEHV